MADCKPCTTPVDTKGKTSSSDGPPVADPTSYQSLGGALQYLVFTQPDITYTVQHVCLYIHVLREPHLIVVKRNLWYLRDTTNFGLLQ